MKIDLLDRGVGQVFLEDFLVFQRCRRGVELPAFVGISKGIVVT